MDNVGWTAHKRAQRASGLSFNTGFLFNLESEYYASPQRVDGHFLPVEQIYPLDETFIGGFNIRASSPAPPALPPKDRIYNQPGSRFMEPIQTALSSFQLTQLSAVERSKTLRIARMHPHLQFMVGPLLKYDTIDDECVWHGAALVVTADSGSSYEPFPILTYEWDPDKESQSFMEKKAAATKSFELSPHPADPHSGSMFTSSASTSDANSQHGPNARKETTSGKEIWVYGGNGGTYTFWRFTIHIPLGNHEMKVAYSINDGQSLEFFVPARRQNFRWASYSCNGFSAGVNPDDFRGPGFQSGYDPCWMDLLARHAEEPFHALVGGGDQLYCDGLTREPELQEWVSMQGDDKKNYSLTDEISQAIDRFYFSHYCQSFRSGAFARANSSIPMMNMAGAHSSGGFSIDGFGSYPDDLQNSAVFSKIGERGYFYFLLFQCFINVNVDHISDDIGRHVYKSTIIGSQGPFIPFPSHSFLGSLGPNVSILLLDCRAERRKDQVCSSFEYQKVFQRLNQLPDEVEHLIIQIGIPIAYPRMVFLETALESKFNPLVALGKTGSLGLGGFVNKFNAEAELLDDLNDHWTSRSHKKERNWFVEQLQQFAKAKRKRISFLSGDVHCAAVGNFKTLKTKQRPEIPPAVDHRYMINVVTSAIVNTPPPNGVISLVSTLATRTHKTLHDQDTDETMISLFVKEPNGASRKQKCIMGRRNYCITKVDELTGELCWDIRVEKEKGLGETVGYAVRTPPPRWS
ncbi:hypothetical protein C8J56DRAFT_1005754 [Mycena floridula]|nr:hypothetical protein C8J56DRAFT_1005754 [Mycena floridula]